MMSVSIAVWILCIGSKLEFKFQEDIDEWSVNEIQQQFLLGLFPCPQHFIMKNFKQHSFSRVSSIT